MLAAFSYVYLQRQNCVVGEDVEKLKQRLSLLDYLRQQHWTARPIAHGPEFLANRRRATLLPLCFHLLDSAQQPQTEQNVSSTKDSSDLWHCPTCGGPMMVVERLTAAQIQLRSPPAVTVAA